MKELAKAFAFLTILVLITSVLANPAKAQTFSSPKIGIHQISSPTVVDPSAITAPLTIAPSVKSFDAATNPEADYRTLNPFSPGRRILETQGQIPSSVFGLNSNPSNRVYGDNFGSYPGKGAFKATRSNSSSTIIENWEPTSSPTSTFRTWRRGRIQLRPFRGRFRW